MKPAGHVHALASTETASATEKGARHAEHATLQELALNVPAAHSGHTPSLPLDPAAHTATHEPLVALGLTGPGSHASVGAQKQAAMLVDALAAVVAYGTHAEHSPAPASAL